MRKTLMVALCFLVFDLTFFFKLFYPHAKIIVTPEFSGGDTTIVHLPYRFFDCQEIKKALVPLWSKNMSFGYPLLGEGEIGAFNPINIITCILFDYKTAFNVSVLLYTFIGQMGLYYFILQLGFSIFAGIYLGLLFPFAPLLIMNYMQILLVYPLFYLPYIFTAVLKVIKKQNKKNVGLLTAAVFFQFTVSHYQVFFMSTIITFVFLLIWLYLNKLSNKRKIIFLVFIAYFIALLLAGPQTLPALEFFNNTNRSSSNYAITYDQNLKVKQLATLIYPYFFGRPQNGSYAFGKITDPWEGEYFIYYLPFAFLLLGIWSFLRQKHKSYTVFLLLFTLAELLALGKNSPIYIIHSLPFFSSFRFPSRYNLLTVFFLCVLSAYGYQYFIAKIKNNSFRIFVTLIVAIILLFESSRFFSDFHMLTNSENLFVSHPMTKFLKNNKLERLFTTYLADEQVNEAYLKNGYNNSYLYYDFITEFMMGNTSIVYQVQAFNNKAGPQLKRSNYFYTYMNDYLLKDDKTASLSALAQNALSMAGIDYVLSPVKLSNNFLKLVYSQGQDNHYPYATYAYQNSQSKSRFQFYTSLVPVYTLTDFENRLKADKPLDYAMVEDPALAAKFKQGAKIYPSYMVLKDTDTHTAIATKINTDSYLVMADTYYPGWKAYVDGHETPLYQTNIMFRGIVLPKGQHTVEFIFFPYSFYVGSAVSIFTGIVLLGSVICLRRIKRLKRV